MKLRMTRPLKAFFLTAAVLELALCAGECVLLRVVPEAGEHYGTYVLFLVLSLIHI